MTPDYLWPHKIDREFQAYVHVRVLCSSYLLCMSYNIFSENELLTPVTPNDPEWISRPITFVEGIQLINKHESHDHTM